MIRLFFIYIRDLYRFARTRVAVNLALMVALGLTEGIGVVMLIPLLNAAGIGAGSVGKGELTSMVERVVNLAGLPLSLPVVLGLYTGVIAGQSWLQRYQSVLSVRIQQSYISRLSNWAFQAVAQAKWSFLMTRTRSDVTHILTSELSRVGSGTGFFLQLLATVLIALVQLGLAFAVSPGLTLWVLAGGTVLFACLYPFVRESRRMGQEISQHNRDLFFEVTEHLNGIKEVKSYGLEEPQSGRFAELRQAIEENFIRFNRVQGQTDMGYKIGAAVLISLFFYAAIAVFRLHPQELLLIVVIFSRLWPRFSSFQVSLQHVAMMLPAFRSVREMEEGCREAREFPQMDDGSWIKLRRGVEFEQVSFAYGTNPVRNAVEEINLTIPAGSTIALVGVSGSGKSTLADLLIGLLTPQRGNILLDGQQLTDQLQTWRRSIGYVSQDAFLFNASIRENLTWASPGVPEAEIWEALKLAAVDEFVRGLPEELNTVVGDRGVRLSGGERQRIVLARALLRKPTLLILDEATSSLDRENERRIHQAIEDLHGKLTIVIIAHRFATIRHADRIYLLEEGRVVEEGNFESLIENKESRFYTLAY